MKNGKQPSTWKDELLSGLIELAFYLACGAVGLGILLLLPDETAEEAPFELLCLLGSFVVVAIGCAVFGIVHAKKTKKQTKNLRSIYCSLKDKHTVTLMMVTRNIDGKTIDVPVIKGRSSAGKFELSEEGQSFKISVEYFSKWGDEKYALSYPKDTAEAIDHIEKFMSNT